MYAGASPALRAAIPMAQLADKYRVTEANPSPPLVHFAIPIDVDVLYEYADKHDLTEYIPHLPDVIRRSWLRSIYRDTFSINLVFISHSNIRPTAA